jgi:hypothetical protein
LLIGNRIKSQKTEEQLDVQVVAAVEAKLRTMNVDDDDSPSTSAEPT